MPPSTRNAVSPALGIISASTTRIQLTTDRGTTCVATLGDHHETTRTKVTRSVTGVVINLTERPDVRWLVFTTTDGLVTPLGSGRLQICKGWTVLRFVLL